MPRKNRRISEAESDRRAFARVVWKHNSFFGYARMMQVQAEAIIKADTTTNAAKDSAMRIFVESKNLMKLLKERKQ